MAEDGSKRIRETLDDFLGRISHCSVNSLLEEEQFLVKVQQGERIRLQLEDALQEKAQLEAKLAAATKQQVAKQEKLQVAYTVVEREKQLRERVGAERDQTRELFEWVCTFLPQRHAQTLRSRIQACLEAAAATTNTDIDVTTDSTFFTSAAPSLAPSSGVESDISPSATVARSYDQAKPSKFSPPAARARRNQAKPSGFTPGRVSSLREQSPDLLNDSFALATECSSIGSSLPSTLLSEDSRKSAMFYPAVIELLKNRPHTFCRKTFVLGEKCLVCAEKLPCGKHALLCDDCRCIAHEQCSPRVPRPCIPASRIVSMHSNAHRSVRDYAPRVAPYVPALVVHCVLQVEQRGLATVGLYKVPSFDRTVQDLKRQFGKNRGVPNLQQVDVLALCHLLKDFLAGLKPGLIAKELFEALLRRFEPVPVSRVAFEMLFDAAEKLDPTSRDTLVFLVLHLQNVAAAEAVNMSARRLSKIFTPLLVDGYESGTFKEEKRKFKLLEKFIELPSDYWKIIFMRNC